LADMVPEGIKGILAGIKPPARKPYMFTSIPEHSRQVDLRSNLQFIASQGSLGNSITSSVGHPNSIPKGAKRGGSISMTYGKSANHVLPNDCACQVT
jgi:hypothetical protein